MAVMWSPQAPSRGGIAPSAGLPRATPHRQPSIRARRVASSKGGASQREVVESLEWQTLAQLESNLDDCSPQVLAYASQLLLQRGALDVWSVPCTMKKGRAGSVLHVLCDLQQRDVLLATILQETTSIGVRVSECRRAALPRRIVEVGTDVGPVRIKVAATASGKVVNAHPEFDDCARAAGAASVPLKAVAAAAMQEFNATQLHPISSEGG